MSLKIISDIFFKSFFSKYLSKLIKGISLDNGL